MRRFGIPLAGLLAAAVLAAMLLPRVIAQIQCLYPGSNMEHENRVLEAAGSAVWTDRQIAIARDAVNAASYPERYRSYKVPRFDPRENGLSAWLDLLALLRSEGAGATTQPHELNARIEQAVRDCIVAAPAALYLITQQRMVDSVMRDAGFSARRAAAEAARTLSLQHRALIRELVNRLLAFSRGQLSAGRSDSARAALTAAIKLILDLLDESPTPELALLASEKLPALLRELGQSSSEPGGSVEREQQAERTAAFLRGWHESVGADDVNLLPPNMNVALAGKAQRQALGALTAFCATAGFWSVLLVLCIALLAVIRLDRGTDTDELHWRWRGQGPWAAAGMVILASATFAAILGLGGLSFPWLLSSRTLDPLNLCPSWLPAWLPLAFSLITVVLAISWGCTRLYFVPTTPATWKLSNWMGGPLIVLLAAAVGSALGVLWHPTYGPPAAIQAFRFGWVCTGLGALPAATILAIRHWRTRETNFALGWGISSRALLAVAGRALLGVTVLMLSLLVLNYAADRRHEAAFVAAAAAPIADRMGPDWFPSHFDGVRATITDTKRLK